MTALHYFMYSDDYNRDKSLSGKIIAIMMINIKYKNY